MHRHRDRRRRRLLDFKTVVSFHDLLVDLVIVWEARHLRDSRYEDIDLSVVFSPNFLERHYYERWFWGLFLFFSCGLFVLYD